MVDGQAHGMMLAMAACLLIAGCAGSTVTDSAISGESGSALKGTSSVTGSTGENVEPLSRSDYVGPHWQLVAVSYRGDRSIVPPSVGAWIELRPSGQLVMKDGVNTSSGRFTSIPEGFRTLDLGTTLAGYVGTDPVRLAVIHEMAAVLRLAADRDGEVSVRMSSGRLVLSVDGHELSFRSSTSHR